MRAPPTWPRTYSKLPWVRWHDAASLVFVQGEALSSLNDTSPTVQHLPKVRQWRYACAVEHLYRNEQSRSVELTKQLHNMMVTPFIVLLTRQSFRRAHCFLYLHERPNHRYLISRSRSRTLIYPPWPPHLPPQHQPRYKGAPLIL